MKIYISHSTSFDYKNELYIPIRASDLNKFHSIILPHEESEVPQKTKELLQSQNIVVAEVSYPSTGQGIELGWAEILNVPILCIYKEDAKISDSLKYITKDFISYTDKENLIIKLTEHLSKVGR